MSKFTDGKGREWSVKVTVGNLEDLAAAGLDVEVVSADPNKLADVLTKRRTFAAVLWVFVGEQVTARQITPEDFKNSLDGPVLFEAAGAVEDAIMSFTLPPKVAEAFREKRGAIVDLAVAKASQQLTAVLDKLSTSNPDGSGNSAGNSEAKPESIPDPSASAS